MASLNETQANLNVRLAELNVSLSASTRMLANLYLRLMDLYNRQTILKERMADLNERLDDLNETQRHLNERHEILNKGQEDLTLRLADLNETSMHSNEISTDINERFSNLLSRLADLNERQVDLNVKQADLNEIMENSISMLMGESSNAINDIFGEDLGDNRKRLKLNEIFKGGKAKTPTRILIEGPAGYGKSTLAAKLCFDHAFREEYIRHFDVVILLRLMHFENTLDELIINTLDLEDYKAEDILEAIRVNQSKVLIILDGFDELPGDKQTAVFPLLKCERLPLSTVVTTSRLGYTALPTKVEEISFTNILRCMDSRIVIEGLTDENKIKFLQLYLKHYTSARLTFSVAWIKDKFFMVFQKGKKNLFDCPLYLLLLVIVAEEEDIRLVKTKTELMKRLFNFILRRMFAKLGKGDQKCDFFAYDKVNPPSYVHMLSNVGFVAMKKYEKNVFSFSEEEVYACGRHSDTIIKLGIFAKKDKKIGLKRTAWFEPVHLSFLEFSIAYHLWATFMNSSRLDAFFLSRYVYQHLFVELRSSVPFLIGLYGRKFALLVSHLSHTEHSEFWLNKFTHDLVDELIQEGKLKTFEIASACMLVVPAALQVTKYCHFNSVALQESLIHAQQQQRLMHVILDVDGVVTQSYENSPCKIFVRNSDYDHMQQEVWTKIISYQNISISTTFECKFVIMLCEAPLDEQLENLSCLMVIEKLPIDKPIREITYEYELCRHREMLAKITKLIRKDVVESVSFDFDEHIQSEPSWEDFFVSANKSKHLLDFSITANAAKDPYYVDLSGCGKKIWRKIELYGNLIPRFGVPSVPLEDKNGQISLTGVSSSSTEFLVIKNRQKETHVFVNDGTPPMVLTLRQVKVYSNNLGCLERAWNSVYLKNLQVLSIIQSSLGKKNAKCPTLLAVLFHCHPEVRLEFREHCSGALVRDFLLQLQNTERTEIRNLGHIASLQLHTLMLSHSMGTKELCEATVNLLKQELLRAHIKYLWVSGCLYFYGLANQNFVNLFSPTEGFTSKLGTPLVEKPPWWVHDEYYIQISVAEK